MEMIKRSSKTEWMLWIKTAVVLGQIGRWGKKSALTVVCGIGLRMLANLIMISIYQGDFTLYRMYGVTFSFLINLSLVGALLLLFFVIDRRTWEKQLSDIPRKWISRISTAAFLVCAAIIIISVCLYTPMDWIEGFKRDAELLGWMMANIATPFKETILIDLNYNLGLVMVISLFLSLWMRTKPRKVI